MEWYGLPTALGIIWIGLWAYGIKVPWRMLRLLQPSFRVRFMTAFRHQKNARRIAAIYVPFSDTPAYVSHTKGFDEVIRLAIMARCIEEGFPWVEEHVERKIKEARNEWKRH